MNLVFRGLGFSKSLTVGLTLTSITTLLLPAVSQSGTRPRECEPRSTPIAQLNDCDLAVAIDVLRATSVIVKALASGAESVMTCETIEQALSISGV